MRITPFPVRLRLMHEPDLKATTLEPVSLDSPTECCTGKFGAGFRVFFELEQDHSDGAFG